MVIRYKNYVGALVYACQIEGYIFNFRIKDSDDVIISFRANIQEIRIVNCIGNNKILSEVTRQGE